MQTQLRHQPSFTVARLHLQPNEPVRVQSGAMMATSPGMVLSSRMEGGLMSGIKRSVLSGESFFVSTYTAPQQGGWVDIAGVLPGDILPIDLVPGRPFYVTRGNWMANSYGTEVDTKWGGRASLFGGEGGFGLQAHGQGTILVSVYGALDIVDLQPGEQIVVDTGHVVAYDLGIQFRMRRAVEGRTIQSMKSGEGFVFDFAGPGRVYLQSRNPKEFATWVMSMVPSSNPQGGLGGIFK
ncbi:TIGR00266 family protein [Epidermidibacterium keratini]|uniref:TIGR00266 family protein n=1 Tax=Epidermidibacterium keratini TaxID=1891644 RepID=A0A7L4YR74_9ACTN|nr:TIGR00266 family protein [Epidermidibacterium keratini]QHC01646.1 TIGR00266 family protein [Epidermidibacterium keratini]